MIKRLMIVSVLFLNFTFSQQIDVAKAKEALNKNNFNDVISLLEKYKKDRSVAVEVNYLIGRAYFGKNDFTNAKEYFDEAMSYNDEAMINRAWMFSSMLRLKEFDKTQKFLAEGERIIKRNKEINNFEYYYEIGKAYFEIDSFSVSEKYYSTSKLLNPTFLKTQIGLANCYLKQGVTSMAIDNFNEAAKLDPKSAFYSYEIGKIYYKERKYTEAAKAFNEAIKLDPKNLIYLNELADLFYRAKLWKDAANTYEKYFNLNPNNANLVEPFARSQYGARMYKESVPNLEKLFAIKQNLDVQFMLSHAYYESGNFDKSVISYNKIPIDSIKKSSDFIYFGRSLVKLKDTTNALNMLEKATQIDTNSIDVAGELAAIFMAQKNFGKAVVQYEKILKVDPKNISALFYGGYSYSVIGGIDSAKNKFLKVIELKPNYLQGRIFLMKMYVELENEVEAKKESEIIFKSLDSTLVLEVDKKKIEDKINPTFVDVYKSLAILEFKSKKYAQSVEQLKKALVYESKVKKDEGLHLFLAQMLNLSGDKENAKKEYDVVLKLNPKNATAKKERSQLQ